VPEILSTLITHLECYR